MKPSPLGSKILSAYAFLFCGIASALLAGFAVSNGLGPAFLPNIFLGGVVAYFAVRVFLGDRRAVVPFASLVVLHYFGMTFSNVWYYDSFPVGSRAQEMAVPRMIRGVVFGSFYGWYYLLRKTTGEGFES